MLFQLSDGICRSLSAEPDVEGFFHNPLYQVGLVQTLMQVL